MAELHMQNSNFERPAMIYAKSVNRFWAGHSASMPHVRAQKTQRTPV